MKRAWSLILALFLLGANSTWIHFRFHQAYAVAWLVSMADVALVTLLFCFRRTAIYAYLLNGMFAIVGTVLMVDYLQAKMAGFLSMFSNPIAPGILVLAADFFVGKALYDFSRAPTR